MPHLNAHLKRLTQWNFIGSTFFELLKASHQIALFHTLPIATYGQIGAIFSMIYLCVHIFTFEAGYCLVRVANGIAHSPDRHGILNRYLVIPQTIIHFLSAILVHYFITTKFLPTPTELPITLIITITILEGVRASLRVIAHVITDSKRVILTETAITCAYFAFIWGGYFGFGMTLTFHTIFTPYLVASIVGTFYLLDTAYHGKTGLPKMQNPIMPTPAEALRRRLALTMLHLPKNIFSANLLVPFFAKTHSMALASYIKIASELAHAVKSIVKTTIGFSAAAIFSTFVQSRQKAFTILWRMLVNGLIVGTLILVIGLAPFTFSQSLRIEGALITAFSILCIIDYLFIAYEHFFIVAGNITSIAFFRFCEAAASAAILVLMGKAKPITTIGVLIGLRSMSLAATVYKAHRVWRISPRAKISLVSAWYAIALGAGLYAMTRYCQNVFVKHTHHDNCHAHVMQRAQRT